LWGCHHVIFGAKMRERLGAENLAPQLRRGRISSSDDGGGRRGRPREDEGEGEGDEGDED